VDTSGYFRYGFLTDVISGDVAKCERAQGAFAKPRFGNECEGFLETQVKLSFHAKNYSVSGVLGWDFVDPHGQEPSLLAHDERYVEINTADNFSYWFGKRTYKRHEAHLYDYKYYHLKGEGFGFEVPLAGDSRLSVARFFKDEFGRSIKGLDIRLVYPFLTEAPFVHTIEFIHSAAHHSDQQHYSSYGLMFKTLVGDSVVNILSLKKASGPLAMHELAFKHPEEFIEMHGYQYLNELVVDKDDWSFGLLTLLENRWSRSSNEDYSEVSWYGVGTRAIAYQKNNLSWVMDISRDLVKNSTEPSRYLTKVSVSLQYAADKGFYSRPLLRFFVTYHSNNAGPNSDSNRLNTGLQFETWW
jgi:maltoporin